MYFVRVGALSNQKILSNPKLVKEEREGIRRRDKTRRIVEKREALEREKNLDYTSCKSPLREYLMACTAVDIIVRSSIFNNYIFACILLAGALVGVEADPTFVENDLLTKLNTLIVSSFVVEIVFRIMAEGSQPLLFLYGSGWKWNLFDSLVVLFGLVPVGAHQVLLLRVIRLMRLGKVIRQVPQFQMILIGLFGGLESVIYIVLLLFMAFYVFSIVGIIFFEKNDPYNFRNIETAMITLFRVATFDSWGEILYINYFGCDAYPTPYYTDNPLLAGGPMGSRMLCTPSARPALTVLFFVSFITIASFCMLSLFIGAVTMAMSESLQTMQIENEFSRVEATRMRINRQINTLRKVGENDNRMRRKLRLVSMVFAGKDIHPFDLLFVDTSKRTCWTWFELLAHYCLQITTHRVFNHLITGVIVVAGILIGLATDEAINERFGAGFEVANNIIRFVFLIEAVMKILSEEYYPSRYFRDNWNNYDFLVVIVSFVPLGARHSLIFIRIFRLLRVLRLMHMLPNLQLVVDTLLHAFQSISFIAILLFLYFYFYAIIGVVLFSANDPDHFGSLQMALFTLFFCSTMDNWTEVMYLSMYGCAVYPTDDNNANTVIVTSIDPNTGNKSYDVVRTGGCEHSQPLQYLGALYWLSFVLVSAFVLISLFIGVVNMSMEQTKYEQDQLIRLTAKVKSVAEQHQLDDMTIHVYKEVFEVIDYTNSGRIGRDEIEFGLKLAGINVYGQELRVLWKSNSKALQKGLNFDHFLDFMVRLKRFLHEPLLDVGISSRSDQCTQISVENDVEDSENRRPSYFLRLKRNFYRNPREVIPVCITVAKDEHRIASPVTELSRRCVSPNGGASASASANGMLRMKYNRENSQQPPYYGLISRQRLTSKVAADVPGSDSAELSNNRFSCDTVSTQELTPYLSAADKSRWDCSTDDINDEIVAGAERTELESKSFEDSNIRSPARSPIGLIDMLVKAPGQNTVVPILTRSSQPPIGVRSAPSGKKRVVRKWSSFSLDGRNGVVTEDSIGTRFDTASEDQLPGENRAANARKVSFAPLVAEGSSACNANDSSRNNDSCSFASEPKS